MSAPQETPVKFDHRYRRCTGSKSAKKKARKEAIKKCEALIRARDNPPTHGMTLRSRTTETKAREAEVLARACARKHAHSCLLTRKRLSTRELA